MEQILRALFDFQRFAGNPALQSIIDDTRKRTYRRLPDDLLEQVSAAGEPYWNTFPTGEKPK